MMSNGSHKQPRDTKKLHKHRLSRQRRQGIRTHSFRRPTPTRQEARTTCLSYFPCKEQTSAVKKARKHKASPRMHVKLKQKTGCVKEQEPATTSHAHRCHTPLRRVTSSTNKTPNRRQSKSRASEPINVKLLLASLATQFLQAPKLCYTISKKPNQPNDWHKPYSSFKSIIR